MPFVQRNEAGEVIGKFANVQPGLADEWLEADDPALAWVSLPVQVETERLWRDGAIADVRWLRERHRDEQDMQQDTTLTAEQFGKLLVYLQQLRDWPQSPDFPDREDRPVAPDWIADQTE